MCVVLIRFSVAAYLGFRYADESFDLIAFCSSRFP